MRLRSYILIVCLLTQFIIAIHPSFVRHFAYAKIAAVSSAPDESLSRSTLVKKARRPIEIVAAHRVPVPLGVTVLLTVTFLQNYVNGPASQFAQRSDTSPPFLAAASRSTYLRQLSLQI